MTLKSMMLPIAGHKKVVLTQEKCSWKDMGENQDWQNTHRAEDSDPESAQISCHQGEEQEIHPPPHTKQFKQQQQKKKRVAHHQG